ncbi:transmembrane protein, putative [Bodo saltans]|uniref:Transmembrane protein, putative n=1 Tax=Bodo saltans TaxID=75058 RepID=A0A0S4J3A1_BODSA|nr:transmembrane protein, putative [Bodo saltans]|eukprot:CUG85819.1 transmembrane protein, putative [Bodo saltans]
MMTCSGKKSWDSNTGPQRLVVSVFYDLGPGAAMLGNAAIALLFLASQSAFVGFLIRARLQRTSSSPLEMRARYPGLSWTVFLFLTSGTLFSAVSLFSAPYDAVFGLSVVGRAFAGSIAILLIASVATFCVVFVARVTWRQLYLTSTSDVLCEPHLLKPQQRFFFVLRSSCWRLFGCACQLRWCCGGGFGCCVGLPATHSYSSTT